MKLINSNHSSDFRLPASNSRNLALFFLLTILIIPGTIFGQGYYVDAIRFSNTQPYGSARIQALGGTSVALGADPSALISNPAGLGLYNRSEVSITPAYNYNYSTSTFNANDNNTFGSKFSLDQITGVISQPRDGIGGWLGGSWGIGVQKINDFNGSVEYTGNNSSNSIVDYFIENANGYPASDFPAKADAFDLTTLAYYNYLIGPWNVVDASNPDDEYFSDVTTFYHPTVQQHERIDTKGSQYQITFGYGGNFADVLYFGFNVGLTTLQYESIKHYSEDNFDYTQTDSATYQPINNLYATEKLNINGTGANLSFGLIVRPVPAFRFGASITTPTMYALNDSYETTMGAEWNNFYYGDIVDGDTLLNSTYMESAIAQSTYSLKTPLKYSLGAAFFLGKMGFISVDADFLNYGSVRLESSDFSLQSDNDYINTNYSREVNLRAGAELRISPLRLRAGYSLNGIPKDNQNNLRNINQSYSAGIGVLFDNFYADFAAIYGYHKSQYSPYLLSDYSEPVIDIVQNTIRGVLTLGIKF